MTEAVSDRLHQAMAARIAKGELPGLVTLVARGGDVQVDTIGVMAFGSNEPMRRDAIFRIASLTKPVLATATMILVEEGKLALDEPVQRLLPELADELPRRRRAPGRRGPPHQRFPRQAPRSRADGGGD